VSPSVLATLEDGIQHRPSIAIPSDDGDPLQVVADGLNDAVHEKHGVVGTDDAEEEDQADTEGELGQFPDAILQATDHRNASDAGDDPNDETLGRVGCSADVAVETIHRGGDRRDAESERRANAKGGARDGKRIDQITDETVDVFTQKRVEGRTDGHGTTVTVANDPERDCDQNIRNPTVDTPVEQRHEDGLLSALIIVHDGNLLRIVVVHAVIPHRFGDAVGVQTDADSAREQHGKPLVIAEGGLFVVPPELDVFVLREKQTDDEDEPHVLGEDVQPRPVDGDPRLPTLHLRRGVDAGRRGPDDEPPKHGRGDARAHPVHAKHLRWTNGRRESVSGRDDLI